MKKIQIAVLITIAVILVALAAYVLIRLGAFTETVTAFVFAVLAIALICTELTYCILKPEAAVNLSTVLVQSLIYVVINIAVSAAFIVCRIRNYTNLASFWHVAVELLLFLGVGTHAVMTFSEQKNAAKVAELNELYRQVYGEDYKE